MEEDLKGYLFRWFNYTPGFQKPWFLRFLPEKKCFPKGFKQQNHFNLSFNALGSLGYRCFIIPCFAWGFTSESAVEGLGLVSDVWAALEDGVDGVEDVDGDLQLLGTPQSLAGKRLARLARLAQ